MLPAQWRGRIRRATTSLLRRAHEGKPRPVALQDPAAGQHLIAHHRQRDVTMVRRIALAVVVQTIDRHGSGGARAIGCGTWNVEDLAFECPRGIGLGQIAFVLKVGIEMRALRRECRAEESANRVYARCAQRIGLELESRLHPPRRTERDAFSIVARDGQIPARDDRALADG